MAVVATDVKNASYSVANKKCRVIDLVFSGNYATGGEPLTAAQCGMKKIDQFIPHGSSLPTSLASTEAVSYNYATSKLLFFEAAAANAPLLEKQNAEAYVAGTAIRASVIGW